jgi:hypothetical protein
VARWPGQDRDILGVEGFGGIERGAESARYRGCGTEIAVDMEEFFRAGVVGFHIGVRDGPCGRDAALVMDDAEVLGAHPEHCSSVDLGLSSDKIGLLWMKFVALLILPGLLRVIAIVEKDSGGVPVEFFLGHEGTALKDQDILAALCKVKSKRSTACSSADDDRVVFDCHSGKMRIDAPLSLRTIRRWGPCPDVFLALSRRERAETQRVACQDSTSGSGR